MASVMRASAGISRSSQSAFDVRGDIARGMDFHLLCAYDRPTAFGLHAAHRGVSPRPGVAHPVAVGDLVETVLGHHGTDSHGLKEDVEARVASHGEAHFEC